MRGSSSEDTAVTVNEGGTQARTTLRRRGAPNRDDAEGLPQRDTRGTSTMPLVSSAAHCPCSWQWWRVVAKLLAALVLVSLALLVLYERWGQTRSEPTQRLPGHELSVWNFTRVHHDRETVVGKTPSWLGFRQLNSSQWRQSLAVVVPFHERELLKLNTWFQEWSRYPPCSIDLGGQITNSGLVFVYRSGQGGPPHSLVEQQLRTIVGKHEYMRCFEELEILSLGVHSFSLLIRILQERFSAVQMVHSNLRFLKKGWIERLRRLRELEGACSNWWVQESSRTCGGTPGSRSNFHVDGSALYALGCPEFEKFLDDVERNFAGRRHVPWDCIVANGMCNLGKTLGYSPTILDRFLQNDIIVDACEDMDDDEEILGKYPLAVIVHSKTMYLGHSLLSVYKRFRSSLRRAPLTRELMEILPMFQTGELDSVSLARALNGIDRDRPEEDQFPQLHDALQRPAGGWVTAFPGKIYLWSVDYHAGPVACDTPVWRDAGAVMHPEIDFHNCEYFGFCKKRLQVLSYDSWRGFSLRSNGMAPEKLKEAFFNHYKADPEFQRVDAFVCSHPVANCQLFVPFNKSIILHATTRWEFGRHDSELFWRRRDWSPTVGREEWAQWVRDLQTIARDQRNVISANNRYDVAYLRYFTGIAAEYIPSWCGDSNYEFNAVKEYGDPMRPRPTYLPTRASFLLGMYRTGLDTDPTNNVRSTQHPILRDLFETQRRSEGVPRIVLLKDAYPNGHTEEDLVSHYGLIVVPYQVSTISILEAYRLNIPLFMPSVDLLIKWHAQYGILHERIYGHPERMDGLPDTDIPNPNDDTRESFAYWIQFADWFHLPYIVLFENSQDLVGKLMRTNLSEVSAQMKEANVNLRNDLVLKWRSIFSAVKGG